MLDLIYDRISNVSIHEDLIRRRKNTKQIVNENVKKSLAFNFNKRIILENKTYTLPFGYYQE